MPSILNILRFLSKTVYLDTFFDVFHCIYFPPYSTNVATCSVWILDGKANSYCWNNASLALIFQFMNLFFYFKMLLDSSIQLQVLFIALFKFKISIWYFLYYRILWCNPLLYHLISGIHKPYTFQELCLNILISKPPMGYVKWSGFFSFFAVIWAYLLVSLVMLHWILDIIWKIVWRILLLRWWLMELKCSENIVCFWQMVTELNYIRLQ